MYQGGAGVDQAMTDQDMPWRTRPRPRLLDLASDLESWTWPRIPDSDLDLGSRILDSEIWKSGILALRCHFSDVRSRILVKPSWGENSPDSIQSMVYTLR